MSRYSYVADKVMASLCWTNTKRNLPSRAFWNLSPCAVAGTTDLTWTSSRKVQCKHDRSPLRILPIVKCLQACRKFACLEHPPCTHQLSHETCNDAPEESPARSACQLRQASPQSGRPLGQSLQFHRGQAVMWGGGSRQIACFWGCPGCRTHTVHQYRYQCPVPHTHTLGPLVAKQLEVALGAPPWWQRDRAWRT